MIVCVCRRVSDRDIARAARGGCATFDELQLELGVATTCGTCRECAQEVLERAQASMARTPAVTVLAPDLGAIQPA